MTCTLSSVRSSPIPDLACDLYRTMSLRDQTLVRRHLTTNGNGSGVMTYPGSQNFSDEPQFSQTLHHFPEYNSSYPDPYLESDGDVIANNGFGVTYSNHHQEGPSTSAAAVAYQQHLLRQQGGVTMQAQENGTGRVSANLAGRRASSLVISNGMAYSLEKYWGESLAFWIILGVLALLVIANSILTFVLYGVLRLGIGMESIEFLPRHLKFFGNTDLDEIYKRDGLLQGYFKKPVEIFGESGGEVKLMVREGAQPSLSVERNVINISNVNGVLVVDKKGRDIFSTNTNTPTLLGLPKGVQKLDVRVAKTNRIKGSKPA